MNNGQGTPNPSNMQLGFRIPDIIPPEVHAQNQLQLQRMRRYIDDMERQNQMGMERWYGQRQQELQQRIEEGEQAKRMLEQLQTQRTTATTPGLPSPQMASAGFQHIARPSTSRQPIAHVAQASAHLGTGHQNVYVPSQEGVTAVQNNGYPAQLYSSQPVQSGMAYSRPTPTHPPAYAFPQGRFPAATGSTSNFDSRQQNVTTSLPIQTPSYHDSSRTSTYDTYAAPVRFAPVQTTSRSTTQSSRAETTANEQILSGATQPSRQTPRAEPNPTVFAQQLLRYCGALKQEIQDEVVARLMSKVYGSRFQRPQPANPDISIQVAASDTITKLKGILQNLAPQFLTAVCQPIFQPSSDPSITASPGHVMARIIMQEHMTSQGIPFSYVSAKPSHQPAMVAPAPSSSSKTTATSQTVHTTDGITSQPSPMSQAISPSLSKTSQRPLAPSVPSVSPALPTAPPAPRPPQISQPQTQRAPSPVTPAKADKTRLAKDIIKALTKPSAATVAAISQASRSYHQTEVDSKGKRKRVDSVESMATASLPDKKPKIHDSMDELERASSGPGNLPSSHVQQSPVPSTPTRSARALAVPVSPEVMEEIKTAGVMEMEMGVDHGLMNGDFSHLSVFDHSPDLAELEPQHIHVDEHISAHVSPEPGPFVTDMEENIPLSVDISAQVTESEAVETVVDASPSITTAPTIPETHPQTPEPVSGTSSLPLFLPSDDEGGTASPDCAKRGHVADRNLKVEAAEGDDFVLNTSLLPNAPRQTMPPRERKLHTHKRSRIVVSDDELNLKPSISRRTSREQAVASSSRLKPPPSKTVAKMSYVQVPPAPAYVVQARAKRETQDRVASVVSDADSEASVEDLVDEQREQQLRALIDDASSRLRELSCHWVNCDASLDSTSKLTKHAVIHAEQQRETGVLRCEWESCGQQFASDISLINHVKSHAAYPVICPHEGCERAFMSGKALAMHMGSSEHRGPQKLRAVAGLMLPDLTKVLPPLPPEIPSYKLVPRHITRRSIEPDHHFNLGARVLANILCYVPPGTKSRQTMPLRVTRQVPTSIAALERALRESPEEAKRFIQRRIEDQNLQLRRRAGPEYCDDLPSEWVTHLVLDKGIVFEDPDAVKEQFSDAEVEPSGVDDEAGLVDGSQSISDGGPPASGGPMMEGSASRERVYSERPETPSGVYAVQADNEAGQIIQPGWTPLDVSEMGGDVQR